MTGEDSERLTGPRGAQGNQGNRGEQGAAGLSRSVRSALVFLFALSVALAGANLLWSAHEAKSTRTAIQAQQHHDQVLQQQAGAALERKLCTTFGRLAANKPPSGNPATNPSRRYDQNNHAILDELGADLGCK